MVAVFLLLGCSDDDPDDAAEAAQALCDQIQSGAGQCWDDATETECVECNTGCDESCAELLSCPPHFQCAE